MTDRYEIRTETLSEHVVARFPELAQETTYVVWDREKDKAVPFGRHSSHGWAVRHASRLNRKEWS